MLIAYPYIPSIHDLWLYEDHQISWSFPDPGTLIVKRPYAWNPTSLMYGYRKSIQAMPAVYRTMTTESPIAGDYGANLRSDPVNRPVFYNSYVPWKGYAFGRRTMIQSKHWQPSLQHRDPTQTYGNMFPANGEFLAKTLVRWIDHQNNVFETTPSNILKPYIFVPAQFGGIPAVGGISVADCGITECLHDIPVPPFVIADARTVPYGTKAFTCDSNFKIAELNFEICGNSQNPNNFGMLFSTRIKQPAGTTILPIWFLHDSGSAVFIEMKPPTSAEAGDGVLGLLMFSLESGASMLFARIENCGLFPAEEYATNGAVLYQNSLGNDYPKPQPYQRQNSQQIATATTQQQVVDAVEQLLINQEF